jgi:hypothetical protein
MLPLLLALSLTSQITTPPPVRPFEAPRAVRVLVVLRTSEGLPTPVSPMTLEIQRIWQSAGVEFQWVGRLPAGEPMYDRIIMVHVTDDPADGIRIPPGALGAVPMVAGRMRQMVYVSPTAIKRLIATADVASSDGQFANLYARTVGRVVAHELGHLLLRSSAHRTTGLMRKSFVARDVVSGDGGRFALGGDDVRLVQDRATAASGADLTAEPAVTAPSASQRRR